MVKYKRLPLDKLVNARDLGGYPVSGGKITKYGVFLRTDCPVEATERDIQFLKDYGVTLSIDLRGTDEVERTPSVMKSVPGHTYVHLPINENHKIIKSDGKENNTPKPAGELPPDFDLGTTYVGILEEGHEWVRKVITLCARQPGCTMFHCFIGKDRAGTIAALILGAVGVCDTDIMMDYSASMSCLRPKYNAMNPAHLPKKSGRPDFSWAFFGSVPESIETALCYLKEKYGGVVPFLLECGVKEEDIQALKDKLLEDAVD